MTPELEQEIREEFEPVAWHESGTGLPDGYTKTKLKYVHQNDIVQTPLFTEKQLHQAFLAGRSSALWKLERQAKEIAELNIIIENIGELHNVTLDEYTKLKAVAKEMAEAMEYCQNNLSELDADNSWIQLDKALAHWKELEKS